MKKIISFVFLLFMMISVRAQVPPTTITNYVEYNSSTAAAGDIIIEWGAELTITGTLQVAPNSSIVIRPGGKLIIDGGKVTSMGSGQMWQGIQVLGNASQSMSPYKQGVLETKNNAVIENAVCAVKVWNGINANTAGGIVHAKNTTFRNNQEALNFAPYMGFCAIDDPYIAMTHFHYCTFILDNNNYLASQNRSFSRHVYLSGVSGITFLSCAFKNESTTYTSTSSLRGKGIVANNNAMFTVKGEPWKFKPNPWPADPIITDPILEPFPGGAISIEPGISLINYASFNGLYMGIDVTNSMITVDYAKFDNTYNGIWAYRCNHATIQRSRYTVPFAYSVRGIYLNECNYYHIEQNTFTGLSNTSQTGLVSYGIYVANSGTNNNLIFRNTFSKMGYSLYVSGNNGTNEVNGTGLQFRCNTFNDCRYGVYIGNNATVAAQQGKSSEGADNKFSGNLYDIRANTQYILLYYHSSTATNTIPVNYTGNVFLSGNATASSCSSTVVSTSAVSPEASVTGEARSSMAQEDELLVDVYPNPVRNNINVNLSELPEGPAQIEFFDMMGRKVHSEALSNNHTVISLDKLSDGMYFYRITSGSRVIAKDKIVKN